MLPGVSRWSFMPLKGAYLNLGYKLWSLIQEDVTTQEPFSDNAFFSAAACTSPA